MGDGRGCPLLFPLLSRYRHCYRAALPLTMHTHTHTHTQTEPRPR